LLISAGTVAFESRLKSAFWDIARHATRGLDVARTLEGVSGMIAAVHQAVVTGLDVQSAGHFAENAFAFEMMISNLGNLPYETNYGELTLEKLWGHQCWPGLRANRLSELRRSTNHFA
jgi:hypothetical protein